MIGKVGEAKVVRFSVKNGDGTARTGLVAGNFTVTVTDPDNSATLAPAVSEVGNGQYEFTITGAFTTTNGEGDYGFNVELTLTPEDTLGGNVRFWARDFDDLAQPGDAMDLVAGAVDAAAIATDAIDADALATDAVDEIADGVWDEAVSGHQTSGTFGRNATTIAAEGTADPGATSTVVPTSISFSANDRPNNMQVVFTDASGNQVVRNVNDFVEATGTFTVDDLGFSPASGSVVFVLKRTGSVPVDASAISTAVWSEALPGSFSAGEAGNIVGNRLDLAISDLRDSTIAAVEYQRATHTAEIYLYVDPTGGNDSNDGSTPSLAKLTIANAVAAVAQEHTAIIVLDGAAGQQVITENITLSTRFTFLRGPGLDVQLIGSSDASPTITISADGCEISGFEVTTPGTGTPDAISITADFVRLRRLRVLNARGHGINCTGGDRLRVEECIIEGSGQSGAGNGILLSDADFALVRQKSIITGSADDNINIVVGAGTSDENVFDDCTITNAGGFGISIGAGVNRTRLTGLVFTGNTSGDVSNGGTDTTRSNTVLEAYGDTLYVDPASGSAGVSFPRGTLDDPVNSLADAFTIADGAGINKFILLSDATMPAGGRMDATFTGEGGEVELDFDGENVDGSTLRRLDLVGDAGGSDLVAEDCLIIGVTNFKGRAFRSRLSGTISLNAGDSRLIQCVSDTLTGPTFDFTAGASIVGIDDYSGAITFANMTAGDSAALELIGAVTIAASCTGGTLEIRGIGEPVVDNSAGTSVDTSGYINRTNIADQVWDETIAGHSGAGSAGLELQNKAEPGDAMDLVADAVDPTSVATDAIDADALAADAVAEIADGVWNEDITTHIGASSAGLELQNKAEPGDAMDLVTDAVDAGSVATSGANEIRDAILSDSIPFDGADVAAILADTDNIQTRLPAALVGGRMDSDVGNIQADQIDAAAIATDAIDADSLAADAVQEIVDGVWDEPIAGHLTAGTTGKALDDAKDAADAAAVADAVWDEVAAGHNVAGSMGALQNLLDDPLPVNVTQIGGSATAAANAREGFEAVIRGTVDTSAFGPVIGPPTVFDTDITIPTANRLVRRAITFDEDASIAGQGGFIDAYALVAGKGRLSVSLDGDGVDPFVAIPADGDTFVIT